MSYSWVRFCLKIIILRVGRSQGWLCVSLQALSVLIIFLAYTNHTRLLVVFSVTSILILSGELKIEKRFANKQSSNKWAWWQPGQLVQAHSNTTIVKAGYFNREYGNI